MVCIREWLKRLVRHYPPVPSVHLNPACKLIPFLPPLVINACKNPENLSFYVFLTPTPYITNGFILKLGKEISLAYFVSSIMFHTIFTPKYGCHPFLRFPISLIPSAIWIAFNGLVFILTPAALV